MVVHSVEHSVDDHGIDYGEYSDDKGKYNVSVGGEQVAILPTSISAHRMKDIAAKD